MKTILVTGFNPFGKIRVNPSQLVIEKLAAPQTTTVASPKAATVAERTQDYRLCTALLPTEYNRATKMMKQLLRHHAPDVVVCLGVASGRKEICLERIALNLDDEALPDNAGVVRLDHPIAPAGPPLYRSTLPLPRLLKALRQARIRSRISNHAGTYLCNHIFYTVRHLTAQRAIPAGFIHLPAIRSKKQLGLPIGTMHRAIGICLAELARR